MQTKILIELYTDFFLTHNLKIINLVGYRFKKKFINLGINNVVEDNDNIM